MKLTRPESHASHPNVVPLIDVIMCLIVFFMLVARIGVSSGEDRSFEVPFAQLGREIKSMDNTLLVNVKEDPPGRVEISAQVDAASGKGRETLVLEGGTNRLRLIDVLKRLRYGDDMRPDTNGKASRATAKDNPELKLIIRGNEQLTFGVLQQVLLAAAEANVTSLNFQTSQKQKE